MGNQMERIFLWKLVEGSTVLFVLCDTIHKNDNYYILHMTQFNSFILITEHLVRSVASRVKGSV